SRAPLVVDRKQEIVAVGINDSNHVVAPPRLLVLDGSLNQLPMQLVELIAVQRDEQPSLVCAFDVLAEDDLAIRAIDLAHRALAVALVPFLREAKVVDVEANRALNVGNEEDGARVPAVSRLRGV